MIIVRLYAVTAKVPCWRELFTSFGVKEGAPG